ncbi:tryptophan halogenase family protein [Thalassomonas actiniarum]|uniref:Tryptophan 7-halogenase n=1 Tax=Thalassomonas actiniarum TaxID=485447 RepID=A0AAF0C215_9GAMM|nr:tryptophan halogenase family protein [Thalassomonas actiniarum]WDD98017.1 tryptophan 7-halogenase [Thalassomonas actiniarum]
MMSEHQAKSIVIVGGGTAGWMAANLMAKSWQHLGFNIRLIESPDIGIIGVGEGSTPQLKGFMDFLGIKESDWMGQCNATYKNGIEFVNWSTKPGFSRYFHPFPAQTDDYSAPGFFHNSYIRRKGISVEGHPDHFFLASYLAKHKLAPIPEFHFPFETNYGYHFDSALLGKFLAGKAEEFGVTHTRGTVAEVKLHVNGDIQSVITQAGETIAGDIFIDCTGFASLLLQQQLKVPFKSFGNNLFNDAAVVLPTEQTQQLGSQTISTALKHGWAWEIPLTNRNGNGYVYSSAYTSGDSAETELRAKLGLLDADVEARHLKMKVGRVEQHWHKNCVAVGLSQGFIEPLEATALHLVQETVQGFIDSYQKGNFSGQYQGEFNASVNARFEAVRDYIVGHYRINSRTDSQYWLDNANNNQLSASLVAILQCWMRGDNLSDELDRQKIDHYYPSISWHCLLAGYGLYPDSAQLKPGNEYANKYNIEQIADFISRCGLNFKPHRQRLAELSTG